MCNTILYEYCVDACLDLTPGVTEIKMAVADWIDVFPALQDYEADPLANLPNTLDGDITFDTTTFPDAAWKSLCLEVYSGALNYEAGADVGQLLYGSTVEGSIPSDEPLAHWALHQAANSKLVVAVKDTDGQWRIVGNPDNPCYLRQKFTTGKKNPDKKGFEITITWDAHSKPVPFYTGTI